MAPLLTFAPALLALTIPTAPSTPAERTTAMTTANSNRATVNKGFGDWNAGRASFYDLVIDDGSVTIAGQGPHRDTFTKATFLRDRAMPFQARFSTPIVPTRWTVWAVDDQVFVRWNSKATAYDGKPYANFITMKDRRATALTMFIDIGAFDDIWRRCRAADRRMDSER